MRLIIIPALALLVGCASSEPPRTITVTETIEVQIPVAVRRTPPEALLAPITAPSPVFVSPDDPLATSALTPEGEKALRGLILTYQGWIAASQAWMLSD